MLVSGKIQSLDFLTGTPHRMWIIGIQLIGIPVINFDLGFVKLGLITSSIRKYFLKNHIYNWKGADWSRRTNLLIFQMRKMGFHDEVISLVSNRARIGTQVL